MNLSSFPVLKQLSSSEWLIKYNLGEFRQQEGKQCLIIVDKQTGQITLEKVTSKSLVGLTRETVIEKIHFKDKETPRVPTPDQASNRSEPKRLKLGS